MRLLPRDIYDRGPEWPLSDPTLRRAAALQAGGAPMSLRDFLAIYDNDESKTVELRELTQDEVVDNGEALYAAKREEYLPPRYILKLAVAQDLKSFLANYPRYKDGAPTDGDEPDADAAPTKEKKV